jgi:hypothetical protein
LKTLILGFLLPLIIIQYVVIIADLKRPVGEDCHAILVKNYDLPRHPAAQTNSFISGATLRGLPNDF